MRGGTPARAWWWIGYTDERRPKGSRAQGCVVVQAVNWEAAVRHAELMGLAPAGAVPLAARMPDNLGAPPPGYANRLLGVAEAGLLAKRWDPSHGGLAGADDIAKAFSDDDAKPGDPLFKGKP